MNTAMKVHELIELAEQLEARVAQDPEFADKDVRIATQPSWPFEHEIKLNYYGEQPENEDAIYLEEGSQIGYLPDDIREQMDW